MTNIGWGFQNFNNLQSCFNLHEGWKTKVADSEKTLFEAYFQIAQNYVPVTMIR
jgi:hypothetical protein